MVTPQNFISRLKSYNYILNKQYHVKVLLKRFHLNGKTIGFHPQTQKLEQHILKKQYHIKVLLNKFYLNRHITDKTIKLKPYNNCFVRKQFWNFIGVELYRSILSRPTTTDFHISMSKMHTEVFNSVDNFTNSVEDLLSLRLSLHDLLVMTNPETSNLSTVEIINQNQIQSYQLACVTTVEALVSDQLGNSKKRSHTGMRSRKRPHDKTIEGGRLRELQKLINNS